MKRSHALALVTLFAPPLLLAACSKPAPAAAAPPPPPYVLKLSTSDLMKHIIDPVSTTLWARSGDVETEAGSQGVSPTSDDAWKQAQNEASILAEAGNMLMLPERIRKLDPADEDWTKISRAFSEAALSMKAAAEARDVDKMVETGGVLYDGCTNCHEKYYIPFLKDGQVQNPDAPGQKQ